MKGTCIFTQNDTGLQVSNPFLGGDDRDWLKEPSYHDVEQRFDLLSVNEA